MIFWYGKPGNEGFAAASSSCRQNLMYENFTSLFDRLRQECFIGRAARAACLFFLDHSSELKQPRRRRQQERQKFAYLTTENNSFARFARVFFIFFLTFCKLPRSSHDVKWPVLQLCGRPEHIGWQMFKFVFSFLKRWLQLNSRLVRSRCASIMTLNAWLRNDCKNAKLHFLMTFSLPSTFCSLKFPIYLRSDRFAVVIS